MDRQGHFPHSRVHTHLGSAQLTYFSTRGAAFSKVKKHLFSLNREKYEIYEAIHKQQGGAEGVFLSICLLTKMAHVPFINAAQRDKLLKRPINIYDIFDTHCMLHMLILSLYWEPSISVVSVEQQEQQRHLGTMHWKIVVKSKFKSHALHLKT